MSDNDKDQIIELSDDSSSKMNSSINGFPKENLTTEEKDSQTRYNYDLLGIIQDFLPIAKDILKRVVDLEERFPRLEEKYKKLGDDSIKIKEELDNLKKEKISIVSIIGVFVAIFTFISIEIQVLRYVTDFLRITGLTLIFLGGIILLVLLINIISTKWINGTYDKIPWIFILIVSVLTLGGILLIYFGDNSSAVFENNEKIVEIKENIEKIENRQDKIFDKLIEQNPNINVNISDLLDKQSEKN
jgi:hypothetical protein